MEERLATSILDKLINHENAWPWQDELREFKKMKLSLGRLRRQVGNFLENKMAEATQSTPLHNFAVQLLTLLKSCVPETAGTKNKIKTKKRHISSDKTSQVELPARKRIKLVATSKYEKTNWVQCDRCNKWRRILREVKDDEIWTCDKNIYFDPQRASCDSPEEDWSTETTTSYVTEDDPVYVPSSSTKRSKKKTQPKKTTITTQKVPKLKIKIRGPKKKHKPDPKAIAKARAESKRQRAAAKLKGLQKLNNNNNTQNDTTTTITTSTTLKRRGGTKISNGTHTSDNKHVVSSNNLQKKKKKKRIPCILLIGPPGAGKGTQGNLLAEKLEWTHISCGDLFRKARDSSGELGVQIRKMLASKDHDGEYAARVLAIDQMLQKITKDCVEPGSHCQGVVLDGCRSVEQARSMEASLRTQGLHISMVLVFELANSLIESRCAGRLIHLASGRVYHRDQNPPKVDGLDDLTGEPLVTRREDSLNVVIERRELFEKTRESVCDYFKSKGASVASVEASDSVASVHENVLLTIRKTLRKKKSIFVPVQRWIDDVSNIEDSRYSKNDTDGTICLLCESRIANRLKDLLKNVSVWNLRRDNDNDDGILKLMGKDRVLREASDRNEYRGEITHLDSNGGQICMDSSFTQKKNIPFSMSGTRVIFSNLKVGTKVSFMIIDDRAVNVDVQTAVGSVFASLSEYVSEKDSTLEWSCMLFQEESSDDSDVNMPIGIRREDDEITLSHALRNLRERCGIWLDPEMCTRQYQGWLRSNLRQIGRMGLTKDLIPMYRDTISRPEVRVYYIVLPSLESILLSPFSSGHGKQDVHVTFLKSVPDVSKRFKFMEKKKNSENSSKTYVRPRKRRIELKKKKKNNNNMTTMSNANTSSSSKTTDTTTTTTVWTDTRDSSNIPVYRNNKTGESVVKILPQPWQAKGWQLMMNRKATMLYWWNRKTNQSVWRSGENSMTPPGV